tara:strand:- start:646 stop:771 length:126 start_codon:yes stop_codon:yes gene_type:complete
MTHLKKAEEALIEEQNRVKQTMKDVEKLEKRIEEAEALQEG